MICGVYQCRQTNRLHYTYLEMYYQRTIINRAEKIFLGFANHFFLFFSSLCDSEQLKRAKLILIQVFKYEHISLAANCNEWYTSSYSIIFPSVPWGTGHSNKFKSMQNVMLALLPLDVLTARARAPVCVCCSFMLCSVSQIVCIFTAKWGGYNLFKID